MAESGGASTRPSDDRSLRRRVQVTPPGSTGRLLFEESFANLDNWYHEGGGRMSIVEPGTMRLEILGSKAGGIGSHAFCRKDFPDRIAVDYDMKVLTPNGLVIAFVAMAGLDGEDLIEGRLPARTGIFADYVGANAKLRSYHVSLSRYNDKGVHSGVSNWRRNPGLHLMNQGSDACKEIQRWYRIRIVKHDKHVQLHVDGRLAHEFVDPDQLPTPLPTGGKFGFRAIGSDLKLLIRGFRVTALK
jgi:hypothetical protein